MSSEPLIEEMTYEQAFAALESVVSSLEKDKQSMDAVLALFERGQALVRRCTALLESAELKVRLLSGEDLNLPDVQD